MCENQATPAPGGIYQALAAILSALGPIGKGQRNKEQGFMYRGIDDVYNALNPLLAGHQVFMIPTVRTRESVDRQTKNGGIMQCVTLTVDYQFCHADGSSVTCTVMGEGRDTADKATNKAMAAAHKYALLQTFCIPTADLGDDDPDRYTPDPLAPEHPTQRHPAQNQPPRTTAKPSAPARLNLEGIACDLAHINTEREFVSYWNQQRVPESHPDYGRLLVLFGKRKKEILAAASAQHNTPPPVTSKQDAPSGGNEGGHVTLDDARFDFLASNTPDELRATAARLRISENNPAYAAIQAAYQERLADLRGEGGTAETDTKLTAPQRTFIQASYSKLSRTARLDDISHRLGRPVASVNDLSVEEASRLVESLHASPPSPQTSQTSRENAA